MNTVGSGSSGAVIANRLSEDPEVSVLLSIPQKTKADWAYYTVPQRNSHLGMNNHAGGTDFFCFIYIMIFSIASYTELYSNWIFTCYNERKNTSSKQFQNPTEKYQKETKSIAPAQIHDHTLSWFGTDNSGRNGAANIN